MKTHKKTPSIATLSRLFKSLKTDICDDYRASDDPDDTMPGICVTVGWSPETGGWSYQTGDNSFTGGAYGHPVWAVVSLYRRSNSRQLACEAVDQMLEAVAY